MNLIEKDKEDLELLRKAKAKILSEGDSAYLSDNTTMKIVLKHFLNSKWKQNK